MKDYSRRSLLSMATFTLTQATAGCLNVDEFGTPHLNQPPTTTHPPRTPTSTFTNTPTPTSTATSQSTDAATPTNTEEQTDTSDPTATDTLTPQQSGNMATSDLPDSPDPDLSCSDSPLVAGFWTLKPSSKIVKPIEHLTSPVDGKRGSVELINQDVDVERNDNRWSISSHIESTLNGAGNHGITSYGGVESHWTAPEPGYFEVRIPISGRAQYVKEPFQDDNTEICLTTSPTLAVLDDNDNVLNIITTRHIRIGSGDLGAEVTEELLEFLAKRLVAAIISPLAGFIAGFIIKLIINFEGSTHGTRTKAGRYSLPFCAEEGHTYKIRYMLTSGVSGRSNDSSGGFHASLKSEYPVPRIGYMVAGATPH